MLGQIIARQQSQLVSGGEWQRSDVAPAAKLAAGALNVRDLVQLGRYVSTNSLIPANGAINTVQSPARAADEESLSEVTDVLPFAGDSFEDSGNDQSSDLFDQSANGKMFDASQASTLGTATVGAGSVSASNGVAAVPIRLDSSGDTAAIQFVVNYNPAKLSIPNVSAVSSRYPNTTFVIDNAPGKLGIVAYQLYSYAINAEVRTKQGRFKYVLALCGLLHKESHQSKILYNRRKSASDFL